MIWLVTSQQELFDSTFYKKCTIEESLDLLKDMNPIGLDTETTGLDCWTDKLKLLQLGNKENQVVIDCFTVDINNYKELLEDSNKTFLGWNLKFDLKWLYRHNIFPQKIYDGYLAEKLLWLGYPAGMHPLSLKYASEHYIGVERDKSIRGKVIWAGLTEDVIQYSANDVKYLEEIIKEQWKELQAKDLTTAIKVENKFVIPLAYCEYCGIHLDANKWKAKMQKDRAKLNKAVKALNDFIIKLSNEGYKKPYKDDLGNIFYNTIDASNFKKYVFIDRQGDLFTGFDLTPKVTVNWSSSQQVVKIAKLLGFNTTVQDKKTGEDKDSVLEKQLKGQKGICDEFLKLYFDYQGYNKVVTSFGQGHLNVINPITHRIHTVFKQLGASSGRMSCGSQQPNIDLAKANHVSPKDCTSPK